MSHLDQLYSDVIQRLSKVHFTPIFGRENKISPAPQLLEHLQLDATRSAFIAYAELLATWSKRIDLVADAGAAAIIENHIQDSLAFALFWSGFDSTVSPRSILDIGSGAGLPGVVLAIAFPKATVVLCEPRSLRGEFLKEVRRKLKLTNIEVAVCRVEELDKQTQVGAKAKLPTTYSHIVSRAVGDYEFLVPLGISLLASEGNLGLMLGPSADTEKAAKMASNQTNPLSFSAMKYILSEVKSRRVFVWRRD